MEAMKETTAWSGVAYQANHTYLMDGSRAIAYIPWNNGAPIYFRTPFLMDKRGRTFERVSIKLFKQTPETTTKRVVGSRGDVYFVDPDRMTCTCAGFTFRGSCKHLKSIG